jgi:chemotaxis protein methyltransferase CheR
MTPAKMTEEEYHLFNELLSDSYGLNFPESKKGILESRLKPRLEALQLSQYMDYYYLLQFNANGAKEIENLANLVTNNESYFFRELHQFESLFNQAIHDLKKTCTSTNAIRVLVAGCSSGEEPYTISIYAKENQYRFWGYSLEIDAFDIDRNALRLANKAEYTERSLRFMDEEKIKHYFKKKDKQRYILKEMYRHGITFDWGNILKLETYHKSFLYDVVFCRNVMIYFSEHALHKAVENFAQCLRPGGLLFLGHSESIIGVSKSFEAIRVGNSIIYERAVQ